VTLDTDQQQKFVAQLAMIPNLKIDYVVLNAGVLRYPNVSPNGHADQHRSRTNPCREPLSCTFPLRRTFLVSAKACILGALQLSYNADE
jgi:hypothetical protein